jgi:hypothetical protein
MEYLWTPLVALFGYLWASIHKVEKKVVEHDTQIETILTAVDEARSSRKEIYDKVDTVRLELTEQHNTLRKEQREDFKDLHNAIAKIGK